MKVTNVKDKGIKVLELDRGDYIINGKRYCLDNYGKNKVEIENITELKVINTSKIVEGYYNQIEQRNMSVDEYNDKIRELLTGNLDSEGCICFRDLDSEYGYRKFKENCVPNYRVLETLTDLIIPEEVVLYETNNKYIKSNFFTVGEKEPLLYKYNRPQARLDIVGDIFKELGFEYLSGASYESTRNKKIWGNSNYNVIRYVTAFGTYLFGDSWKSEACPIDTLEECFRMYETDKEQIRKIIMRHYNENYNRLSREKLALLPEKINLLQDNLKKVSPYQKSYRMYKSCIKQIEDIQNLISESFESEGE